MVRGYPLLCYVLMNGKMRMGGGSQVQFGHILATAAQTLATWFIMPSGFSKHYLGGCSSSTWQYITAIQSDGLRFTLEMVIFSKHKY